MGNCRQHLGLWTVSECCSRQHPKALGFFSPRLSPGLENLVLSSLQSQPRSLAGSGSNDCGGWDPHRGKYDTPPSGPPSHPALVLFFCNIQSWKCYLCFVCHTAFNTDSIRPEVQWSSGPEPNRWMEQNSKHVCLSLLYYHKFLSTVDNRYR